MLVLGCNNISKSYLVDPIIENINFTLDLGDKVGLVGVNGSGKTTLFNILSGEISKDSGDIYLRKDTKIGYLPQHMEVTSSDTVFNECLKVFKPLIQMEENLRTMEKEISKLGPGKELDRLMDRYGRISEEFLNKNGYGYVSSIKGSLKGLGFEDEDLDKKVEVLSGGQKSRLALCKLLLSNPDILLLDEPTNHLDIEAIGWLERFLKDYKGAALIISHDRYFLDNVVNRIFHLENLSIKTYNTNYTDFIKRRKKDLEIQKKHYEDQQREIKRQREIIEKFKAYGTERYYGLAKSREKLLAKMEVIDPVKESKQKTRIKFEPRIKSGEDVLSLKDINKSYGDLHLLKDISLNIYRGEKVGLIGGNGVGKTSLFKIILRQVQKDSGQVHLGHQVHIGYFDQEMDNLNLDKTIIDEIWDENPEFTHYDIRTVLSQFMFIGDDIFKEIKDLSGGERGRLSLLKLMLSEANFLLMDEPTNHLDIDSKEVLEEALRDYEGSAFVISHDRYFLNRAVDKIYELTEEGITEYLGNYDYYLEKKKALEGPPEEEANLKTKTQIQMEKRKEKDLIKRERQAKKEIKEIENKIHQLEDSLEDIYEKLCQPEIYEDGDKVRDLNSQLNSQKEDLDLLYLEWISLTED